MTEHEIISVRTTPGVRAVFTTRHGGVSNGPFASCNLGRGTGDRDNAVRENRRGLCDSLGIDPNVVRMGSQVHGTSVHDVDEPSEVGRFLGELSGWPDGDGLVTGVMGLPLMVVVADCVPVLVWSADGRRVGAVHAGWRGLVDGILATAVSALNAASPVHAAIGPSAGPCCYEVDGELARRFADEFGPQVVEGRNVDLPQAARHALVQAGVADADIHRDGSCTVCAPERFFSYRRDGETTGRQAGLIWREAAA
jgi:YfiH family protein